MTGYSQLLFRDEARSRILSGASTLADAVRGTLGPRSKCVLMERKWASPLVCDDGVTIAKQIRLKDPEENLGALMMKEVAVRTGDAVGDGTTTSTLLAHAMFADAVRNVTAGANPISLKRGLERGAKAAIEALRGFSRPVSSSVEREQVATVSAHGDASIGTLVAEALDRVGGEGIVTVEEAKGTETSLEVVEGMQLDRGYLSPYFVTDAEKMEVVLQDPLILLHEKKIHLMRDLLSLLEDTVKAGKPLLIIAEDVEGEALATLVVNKLRGTLACAAVKAPGFGDRRKAMLRDLAVLTGGQLVAEELGLKLESLALKDLGRARRVVIDRDTTTIIGGAGDPAAIEARCNELRSEIEQTQSDYDRDKLEERLARLSGGVALIQVGAPSETEMRNRKDAFEDAISSTQAAIEEGIVPGGGLALLRATAAVEREAEKSEGDEQTGVRIVKRALEVPVRQIAANSGVDGGVVVDHLLAGSGDFGFDANRAEYRDLAEAGIIDPTKVVRVALENAVSVAGTLLLAEATLTEIEPTPPAPQTAAADFA
ncbi:MAG: chaperonin GroEL [Myxococcales bacterium]|nr:chaperonin GroEL [Myxococcales bacterium]MDH5306841.1 chaperonin GroEL [Myxococcales bacterium]